MTLAASALLIPLFNFFGPIAFQAALENAFGRHWSGKLVAELHRATALPLSWKQRRSLRRALAESGFDALIAYGRGQPDQLRDLVASAIREPVPVRVDDISGLLVATVVKVLEPADRAAWIDARIADLQDSVRRQGEAGSLSSELGGVEFCRWVASAARLRRWRDRAAAGLSSEQVAATFELEPPSVALLIGVQAGSAAFVIAPVGSGKSDLVLAWLASVADRSAVSQSGPLPVLLRADTLGGPLRDAVLAQVPASVLRVRGADVVVDGLDEPGEFTASLSRQVVEFAAEWPRCRVVATSRLDDVPMGAMRVEVPKLDDDQVTALMGAVTRPLDPPSLWGLNPEVKDAVHRPLFAIFAAVVPRGSTTYELVEEMARRSASERPSAALRDLALAIVRQGSAVDPREVPALGDAAVGAPERLVASENGRWRFQLPIFLQWFAAQGVLDGSVPENEYTTLAGFARWRYVLALALSGASSHKLDELLPEISRWNPGAASWLLNEVRGRELREPGLVDINSDDLAHRGLLALNVLRIPGASNINGRLSEGSVTVSARIGPAGANLQWRSRLAGEGATDGYLERDNLATRPGWVNDLRSQSFRALSPWLWTLDLLDKEIEGALEHPHLLAGRDSVIWQEFLHRAWVQITGYGHTPVEKAIEGLPQDQEHINYNGLIIHRDVLDDLAATPNVWRRWGPWTGPDIASSTGRWVGSNYSHEALATRSREVLSAALDAYLDLVEGPFAAFGDVLPNRARLPGTWVAKVHPPGDNWTLVSEWFEPDPSRGDLRSSRVSVEIVEQDEPFHSNAAEIAVMEAYARRLEQDPGAEFALRAMRSMAVFDIFGPRPATDLAIKLLGRDLQFIGRLGKAPLRDLR